ncbi:MAG: thioredoxin domain-containing protein, partial [Chromatiales bacterium]|nr:thioredoxin domain-containing protein [Chromatiales bacterium]
PHFEKMLYDNGPLLSVYADAYQITQHPELRRFSLETACWVMRDMQSSDGGFYSSFDADSEGEEGKFYVWDKEEVQGLLNAQEFAVLGSHFGLDRAPNFEGARWNLHVFEALDTSEGNGALSRRTLDAARAKLLTARNRRIAPNRDDKVLVSWNALMVKGLVKAGVVLQQPDFIDSAERALEFIRQQMWQDGRLLATYKDGRAHLNAYLDDYAFMLDALLEALAARWNPNFLVFALSLADALLDYFEDQENGGFYFTSSDHERLILRPKSLMDEATPSGAAVAAVALQRLGHLVGDIRYLQAAERTVRVAWSPLNEYPHAHGVMLQALEELLLPTETIVLRGEAHELGQWHKCAMACYAPGRQVVAIPGSGTPLPGLLASRTAAESGVVAYICAGHHCDAPITDFATFERRIGTTQLEPQRVEVVAR